MDILTKNEITRFDTIKKASEYIANKDDFLRFKATASYGYAISKSIKNNKEFLGFIWEHT